MIDFSNDFEFASTRIHVNLFGSSKEEKTVQNYEYGGGNTHTQNLFELDFLFLVVCSIDLQHATEKESMRMR